MDTSDIERAPLSGAYDGDTRPALIYDDKPLAEFVPGEIYYDAPCEVFFRVFEADPDEVGVLDAFSDEDLEAVREAEFSDGSWVIIDEMLARVEVGVIRRLSAE